MLLVSFYFIENITFLLYLFIFDQIQARKPRKEITLNELDLRRGKVGSWDGNDERRGERERDRDREDRRGYDREKDRERDREDRRGYDKERSNNKLGWGDDEVRKSMLSSSVGRRSPFLNSSSNSSYSLSPPPPTEEEARKNRKKHRKARREATLTQIRKGREGERWNGEDDDEDDYDEIEDRGREREKEKGGGDLILPPIANISPPISRSRSKPEYNGNTINNSKNKSPTRARGEEHFLSYSNQRGSNNNYNNNSNNYNKSPSPSRTRNNKKFYDDEDDDDVIITHHPFGT